MDEIRRDIREMEELIEQCDAATADLEGANAETVDEAYPWAKDMDEARRNFIFEKLANRASDYMDFVETLSKVENWVKNGTMQGVLKVVK